MDKELEKMYFNYITNMINYFEIKDITGFREAVASFLINQPDPKNEEAMDKWSSSLSGTILTFSTLSEEELEKRFKVEFKQVQDLVEELDKEKING